MISRTSTYIMALAFATGVFIGRRLPAPARAVASAPKASAPKKAPAKKYAEIGCRDEINSFGDWKSLRAEFLDREIQRVLLSERRSFDFKDLCPNYAHFENPVDFWADLLKEIAGHASDFHPLQSAGDPGDHDHVARGLFQIDEFTARRYRCDLRGIEPRCALHDPRVAAGCALKIVSELSGNERQVSKNLAERWSSLRQRREVHATFEKNESCTRPKAPRYEPLQGPQTAWSSPRFPKPAPVHRTARDDEH